MQSYKQGEENAEEINAAYELLVVRGEKERG